jgi:FkbM family methyltransferase
MVRRPIDVVSAGAARARDRVARFIVKSLTCVSVATSRAEWLNAVSEYLSRGQIDGRSAARLITIASASITPATANDDLIAACERALGGSFHYSQEGEDILLLRLLGNKRDGFFVDVGAHHATRFSNTYALYRRGWRGVNIDATPGSIASFEALRPEDTNVECAVSDGPQRLTLHVFQESALNTFDSGLAASYVHGGYALKGTVELTARPLASILDDCVPAGRKIDLLSVDVEGSELAVLRSNDWARYAPEIVIIEVLDTPLSDVHRHPCVIFLDGKGYVVVARLTNSIMLQRRNGSCAAS